jgi:hypothetical protein
MNKIIFGISVAITCGIAYSFIGYYERGFYGMIADFLRGIFFSGISIGLFLYLNATIKQVNLNNLKRSMILFVPIVLAVVVGIGEYPKIQPISYKVSQAAAAFLLGTGILTFIFEMKKDRNFRHDMANKFIAPIVGIMLIGLIIFLIWLFSNY